jgi:hypothetical protein
MTPSNHLLLGTGLNALPPQNLFKGSYPGATGNATPYAFSEGIYPAANPAAGLRGNQSVYAVGSIPSLPLATKYPPGALVAEQGWPPGNFNPTNRLDPPEMALFQLPKRLVTQTSWSKFLVLALMISAR